MTAIKATLKDLLTSKKFLTAAIGLVVIAACHGLAKVGIQVDPDKATQDILVLFGTYIGAQGIADFGKSKAQVEAQQAPPTDPPQK